MFFEVSSQLFYQANFSLELFTQHQKNYKNPLLYAVVVGRTAVIPFAKTG